MFDHLARTPKACEAGEQEETNVTFRTGNTVSPYKQINRGSSALLRFTFPAIMLPYIKSLIDGDAIQSITTVFKVSLRNPEALFTDSTTFNFDAFSWDEECVVLSYMLPDTGSASFSSDKIVGQAVVRTTNGAVITSNLIRLNVVESVLYYGEDTKERTLSLYRPFPDIPYIPRDTFVFVDLAGHFSTTIKDAELKYTVSAKGEIRVLLEGSRLRITGTGTSGGEVSVTVTDDVDTRNTMFCVVAYASYTPELPIWASLPTMEVNVSSVKVLDLRQYCVDPEGGTLRYALENDGDDLIAVTVTQNGQLVITGGGVVGTTTVSIIATNSNGAESATILLVKVVSESAVVSKTPIILVQPVNISSTLGSVVTFRVTATNYVSIVWMVKKPGQTEFNPVNDAINSPILTLNVTPSTVQCVYKAVLTNSEVGKVATTIETNWVVLSKHELAVPPQGVYITVTPGTSPQLYATVTLSCMVTVGTYPINYRFRKGSTVIRDWSDVHTCVISNFLPADAGQYFVDLYNPATSISTPITQSVTLSDTSVDLPIQYLLVNVEAEEGTATEPYVGSTLNFTILTTPSNVSNVQFRMGYRDASNNLYVSDEDWQFDNSISDTVGIEPKNYVAQARKVSVSGLIVTQIGNIVESQIIKVTPTYPASSGVAIDEVEIFCATPDGENPGLENELEFYVDQYSPEEGYATPVYHRLLKDGNQIVGWTQDRYLHVTNYYAPYLHDGLYIVEVRNAVMTEPVTALQSWTISWGLPYASATLDVASIYPRANETLAWNVVLRVRNTSNSVALKSSRIKWVCPVGVLVNGASSGYMGFPEVASQGSTLVNLTVTAASIAATERTVLFFFDESNVNSVTSCSLTNWGADINYQINFISLITSATTPTCGQVVTLQGLVSPSGVSNVTYVLTKNGSDVSLSNDKVPYHTLQFYSPLQHDGTYVMSAQGFDLDGNPYIVYSAPVVLQYAGNKTTLTLSVEVIDNGTNSSTMQFSIINSGANAYSGGRLQITPDLDGTMVNGALGSTWVSIPPINSGATHVGTVVISRTDGVPDEDVLFEIRTGNLNSASSVTVSTLP